MNAIRILFSILLVLSFFHLLRFETKRTINFGVFLFWSALLIGSLVLYIRPDISENISYALGIGRGVDSIFFLAILLLFYLNFQLYIRLQKLDQTLTSLTIRSSQKIHSLENSAKQILKDKKESLL